MNTKKLQKLLEDIKSGRVDIDSAMERLRFMPFDEGLDFATVDTHRSLRRGFPEVIYGAGKTAAEIRAIAGKIKKAGENVLITRLDAAKSRALRLAFKGSTYNKRAGTLFIKTNPVEKAGRGDILVLSAGTSDIPVAEEAAVTAESMGNSVKRLYDVGVSGLHRLLYKKEELASAMVIVVVAGMEGALPSVVAGLVARPVIAVPTSIGYGANLGGLTTLMAMLNSCASGITVVNIDNGFGAGYAAAIINKE
ncbi:MAG: nickel pincer cofactor biosynthesis protein LarB [Thermodesulfobacteriota bacterium]